jgi:hypothetical protein
LRQAGVARDERGHSRRKYSLPFRLLIFGVSLLVALAAAEVAVRLLPEKVLGFTYNDGWLTPARQRERDTFRNSLDRHDIEHELQKPPASSTCRRFRPSGWNTI